jgi:N-acyl-D-aspartate/D-glutamate deacylase
MSEYDLVIRGGEVVDGTGSPSRTADVAVSDGVIAEVGKVSGSGRREIDADGALITPGWVDIHTHYDAQVTWDNCLAPSSWQGVTTVVMGNCGVGFAPVQDADHDRLIQLMEGVEDIPGTALHDGLTWGWNTFAEYLDAADRIAHDIDFGVYVPHDPLRLFVMGERGARREAATDEDIALMGQLARAGVEAGALGFSTDRIGIHTTSLGDHTPSYGASARECIGIAQAVGEAGTGVLHVVSDLNFPAFEEFGEEFDMLRTMVERSGLSLSFTLFYGHDDKERHRLRALLSLIESANADGLPIMGQVAPRAAGFLFGLQCTLNPFTTNSVFNEIAALSPSEQAARMSQSDFRRRLLANLSSEADFRVGGSLLSNWEFMFELSDPPNYEPDLADSLAARAAREGRSPEEVVYDILVKDDGKGMIYLPLINYGEGNLDAVKEMLEHPYTLPGLGDGGAHVGGICDASFPTTLLAHWGRNRERGLIDIPYLVKQQCADTAHFVGLADRGVLAPGYQADVNVIDLERLSARRPEVWTDLPGGAPRLMQKADGYVHTISKGIPIYENGSATGDLPGRLVRGRQPAPRP